MALTPALIRISAPSANGKNASDAATAPLGAVGSVSQRVGTLDGQIGGIHTIDLAHADAYGCLIVSDKYGVGFDAPDGTPCEHQIPDGFSVGRLAGNQLPRVRIVAWSVNQIGGLHEQTAVNLTELGLGLRRLRHLQDTQVLLLGLEQFKRIGVVIGRDDDFGED